MQGRYLELVGHEKIARNEIFLRMTSHCDIYSNARDEVTKKNARKKGYMNRCHE